MGFVSSGDEVNCLRVAICSMMFAAIGAFRSSLLFRLYRCCSLTGPLCGWSAVVLSDCRYPSFWNFDSTISIDVIKMKSYMDSLFDPTCVPVRVTINKRNFFPNRKMPRFVSILITSIEIVESKFQKLGYLRSESITADQPQSGPVREQHLIVGIIMRIEMHQ